MKQESIQKMFEYTFFMRNQDQAILVPKVSKFNMKFCSFSAKSFLIGFLVF